MRRRRERDVQAVPGERAYRMLLRLHPRGFRRRYEEELVACVREAWREEGRGRGLGAAWGFWARTISGTVTTAWRQRTAGETVDQLHPHNPDARMATRATRLDDWMRDARYAVRMLRRSPGFSVAVLLTLGLGIGSASAVYTVVQDILLKPLPYPAAERLYRVSVEGDDGSYWLSAPNYLDLKANLGAFESLGAYTPDGANMVVEGEPARVSVAEADPDFFRTLGVSPALGRTYTEDERAAAAPVAVVSQSLWVERMGGRPDAVGSTLVLDSRARTVIGVLSAGPMVPPGTDVWVPLNLEGPEWRTRRGITWIQVVGRLRPNTDLRAARAEAAVVGAALRDAYPDVNKRFEVGFRSLEEAFIGSVRSELRILMGAVGLVLLVATINAGGLVLARLVGRDGELAVRKALGGDRARLFAQFCIEGVVLAAFGLALGLAFGKLGVAGLVAAAPPETPRLDEVAVGMPAVVFAVAAAAFAALAFAVLPALAALRQRDAAAALRASRGGGGHRVAQLRGGLVVAQVGLALALLFSAGLLGKSFWRLQQVDLGFDPDGVLVAGLPIGDSDFESAEAREAYYQAILERAKTLPGVTEAALTSSAPFDGFGVVFSYEFPDGPAEEGAELRARFRVVTRDVFATLRIPLVRGRTFTREETRAGGTPGAVVSEDLVRRHHPGEDVIGKRIVTAGDTFQIVGVVPSIRDVSAREASPFPFIYVPVRPAIRQSMTLVMRTNGDAAALAEPVRRMVRELAPAQPVVALQPLRALIGESVARARFTLLLLMFFAVTTLMLAGVGLYGVLAYAVGRRTREIGVRVALGAPAGRVRALVMRHAFILVAAGCIGGLVLAFWGSRFLEILLFEVDSNDPTILGGTALALLAVTFLAAWMPARRATRISPAEALRSD